ncbi:ubiquitin-like protein ISG15 [Talpa occidentalis]|uniref:ubiquitin-like protein ISG15 n=1 Tax=Talpa occidentalis TaxID=50954 RepID=UPI00188ECFF0|nr:ubiquitin-like protein ISG15 [Talpa occidentalis]
MGIHLKVKMLDGREFLVPFKGSMTVQELKQQLAQRTGVPAFQQRLLHPKSTVLEDGKTLAHQGLGPDSTIGLVVQPCDTPLSILVSNSGRSRAYEVLLTQTVAELKEKVCRQEGMQPNQIWLSFQETRMEDHQQLGELGLTPNCTVVLHLHLRGGAPTPP